MTLVRLIVTGETERHALGTFLQRFFPELEFELELAGSFTSCRVSRVPAVSAALPLVDKLAQQMIAAVDPGRKKPNGPVPDLVVVVDDLELFNLDQPDVVISSFRSAIHRSVPRVWPTLERQNRCLERLKERASFHLLCPMLEAYFFTSDSALRAAGIRLQSLLVSEQDIEDFETCDASYLSRYAALPDDGSDGVIHPKTKTWFAKHPKEYLRYLVAGGDGTGPVYRETKQGVAALQALSPADALAMETHRRFLRSLIHDVAFALNRPLPDELRGECHPKTSGHSKIDRLLRNI